MFCSPSNLMISFSFISAHVLGMAVPRSSPDLQSTITGYFAEVTAQDQAIEGVQNLLNFQDEVPEELVSSLCNELIESYYRQIEPRNRMVERVPTDAVLDFNSLEYFVTVASRYANNVLHFARLIRKDPLDVESSSALKELKKEHQKTQMFDEILLGLADVAQSQESDGEPEKGTSRSGSNEKNVFTEVVTGIQNGSQEGSNVSNISVAIEEGIETIITETVVTSFKETIVQ